MYRSGENVGGKLASKNNKAGGAIKPTESPVDVTGADVGLLKKPSMCNV